MLDSEVLNALWTWSDEDHPGVHDLTGEVCVLGQEPIARYHRICSLGLRNLDDLLCINVSLTVGSREQDSFIGGSNMSGGGIGSSVYRYCSNTELASSLA